MPTEASNMLETALSCNTSVNWRFTLEGLPLSWILAVALLSIVCAESGIITIDAIKSALIADAVLFFIFILQIFY